MKINKNFINLDYTSSDALTSDDVPFDASDKVGDLIFKLDTVTLTGTNVDWSLGKIFTKSISSDETFTFTNVSQGQIITLDITSSSSANLTLPATVTVITSPFELNDRNVITLIANNGITEQMAEIYQPAVFSSSSSKSSSSASSLSSSSVSSDSSVSSSSISSSSTSSISSSVSSASSASSSSVSSASSSSVSSSSSAVALGESTLSLNGTNQYLTISDTSVLDVTNVSFGGWFYIDQSGGGQAKVLMEKWNTGTNNRSFTLQYDNLADEILFSTSVNGTSGVQLTHSITLNNAWAHIICTYDGTTMRIYLDGSDVASTGSQSGDLHIGTADLTIGARHDNTIHMKGSATNIIITNRELTSSEITEIYNSGTPKQPWEYSQAIRDSYVVALPLNDGVAQ